MEGGKGIGRERNIASLSSGCAPGSHRRRTRTARGVAVSIICDNGSHFVTSDPVTHHAAVDGRINRQCPGGKLLEATSSQSETTIAFPSDDKKHC